MKPSFLPFSTQMSSAFSKPQSLPYHQRRAVFSGITDTQYAGLFSPGPELTWILEIFTSANPHNRSILSWIELAFSGILHLLSTNHETPNNSYARAAPQLKLPAIFRLRRQPCCEFVGQRWSYGHGTPAGIRPRIRPFSAFLASFLASSRPTAMQCGQRALPSLVGWS